MYKSNLDVYFHAVCHAVKTQLAVKVAHLTNDGAVAFQQQPLVVLRRAGVCVELCFHSRNCHVNVQPHIKKLGFEVGVCHGDHHFSFRLVRELDAVVGHDVVAESTHVAVQFSTHCRAEVRAGTAVENAHGCDVEGGERGDGLLDRWREREKKKRERKKTALKGGVSRSLKRKQGEGGRERW